MLEEPASVSLEGSFQAFTVASMEGFSLTLVERRRIAEARSYVRKVGPSYHDDTVSPRRYEVGELGDEALGLEIAHWIATPRLSSSEPAEDRHDASVASSLTPEKVPQEHCLELDRMLRLVLVLIAEDIEARVRGKALRDLTVTDEGTEWSLERLRG